MSSKLLSIAPKRIGQSMLAVAVVFALTLIMLLIGSNILGEGVIALLYLVPIGWCTVRWGQLAGVAAALTAALCFDFLFIPPYGTFNIGSLEGWLLLFLFIASSIFVVGRIQTMLSEVQNRERNATFLYEFVVVCANLQTREDIASASADMIQQRYLAEFVQVRFEKRGLCPQIVRFADNGLGNSVKGKPDRRLPIVAGPTLIGEISIWKGLIPLPSEDDPILQTLLRQIAVILDRVQTVEEKGLQLAGSSS